MTPRERGWGWALLAGAYQGQGRFAQATTAFEKALRVLRADKGLATDYAATLSAFGSLLSDTGQSKAALRIDLKALHIYEAIDDPAGVAVASSSLADLELGFKHLAKAKAYLKRSA